MDPNMLLSWHNYGGGRALLDEIYKSLNLDVVSYLYGPMPTQPFGWFKKPIAKAEDMKGMKFRTVGLAVDMYTDMGAAVNPLPGGEIVPALDRGLIDGAEFNNATSDRILGFPDVAKNCMLQSFHQSTEQFEILFNKGKYDALPQELRSTIDYAVQAASADMSWKAVQRNSQDYIELKKQGVKFYKTPDAILRQQLVAWDKIMAKKSGREPHLQEDPRLAAAASPSAPAPGRTTTSSISRWPTTTTSAATRRSRDPRRLTRQWAGAAGRRPRFFSSAFHRENRCSPYCSPSTASPPGSASFSRGRRCF
jgi:TRAP-type mannitol/chloroaromatic compound transport system substrate-binding protein